MAALDCASADAGGPRMTKEALLKICQETEGYETPELNDNLYAHFKGFRKIENLEPYSELKGLWLEANGLQVVEGLGHLSKRGAARNECRTPPPRRAPRPDTMFPRRAPRRDITCFDDVSSTRVAAFPRRKTSPEKLSAAPPKTQRQDDRL